MQVTYNFKGKNISLTLSPKELEQLISVAAIASVSVICDGERVASKEQIGRVSDFYTNFVGALKEAEEANNV